MYQTIYGNGMNFEGPLGIGKQPMAEQMVKTLQPMDYFNKKGINIKQICTNAASECVFWMTDKNDVYGTGSNGYAQLGTGDLESRFEPQLIPFLSSQNVLDIKSSEYCSIALCTTNNSELAMIIRRWSRIYNLPTDVAQVIVCFVKCTSVYSTGENEEEGNGHPHGDGDEYQNDWREIEALNGKDIISIAVGDDYSFFLESNGVLWGTDSTNIPTESSFFKQQAIMIKRIECGANHNLAVDYDDNVYSWGANGRGQCGDGTQEDVDTPKLIEFFKNQKVRDIGGGADHSFVRTDKFYLFGSNEHGQCSLDNNHEMITVPKCFEESIESMSLGYTTKSFVMRAKG